MKPSLFQCNSPATSMAGLFNKPTAHAQAVNPQFVTNFTYDPLSRLQSASYPETLAYSYTYDSVGNRLTQNVATPSTNVTLPYTYNNDNQLTNIGAGTLTYDNNGNQTKITNSLGNTSFLYNFENRLTKYTPPTGSSTAYTYDGNNNRLAKNAGGITTRFVTDIVGGLPRVLAETNNYNTIQKSYIYGAGLISQGSTSTSSRNYYLEDGQGNIRFVTDYSGNKVRSTEYDPFGNWRTANGQANIQMLYQGEQQDPESNLYYLRARYYDPATGRFISRDPVKNVITDPQNLNGYSFARNNPIIYSDPSGLWYVDVGVSSGIIGPLGAGAGVQINDKGVTPYVAGGVITPGKGVTVTFSPDDPQPNSTTVNFAANFIVAGNVSYPFKNEVVPVSSGEVSYGVGFPAGASATVNRTFSTLCW